MTSKIIIAGFGGQGIIFAGKLLSYAAMKSGFEVSTFASYGAEMRGGTCNCSVIISDKEIASPIVSRPDTALILNAPSKTKFENKITDGGMIFLNSSLADEKAKRNDLKTYYVKATEKANELGNVRIANMIMLGAYLKVFGHIKFETLAASLEEVVSSRNKALVDINVKALKAGFEL
jgi:2-oxoglutarate ferredoxin oxidoreductase subunit gamma